MAIGVESYLSLHQMLAHWGRGTKRDPRKDAVSSETRVAAEKRPVERQEGAKRGDSRREERETSRKRERIDNVYAWRDPLYAVLRRGGKDKLLQSCNKNASLCIEA